jgi:tRNA(adenine34) deaminase
VGAVVVKNGVVIGEGWNLRETNRDALHHAEIMAIQEAAKNSSAWRLSDTTLYVTLEPCLMCAGPIYQASIPRLVFGAVDPKAGACRSLYQVHEDTRLNHRYLVQLGALAEQCSEILKEFFRGRRQSKSTTSSDVEGND